jgi:hypothetical protein
MQEQYWTSHAVLQKRNGEPPSLAHGTITEGPMRARRIRQHELGKARERHLWIRDGSYPAIQVPRYRGVYTPLGKPAEGPMPAGAQSTGERLSRCPGA